MFYNNSKINIHEGGGVIDGKIWDLGSPGIGEFSAMDYIYIDADEDEKIVEVMVSACDVDRFKKEAMDYIIPTQLRRMKVLL